MGMARRRRVPEQGAGMSAANHGPSDRQKKTELMEKAQDYAKKILPAMEDLRSSGDLLEELLGQEYKPYPSYEDLLFSVQ